MSKFEITWLEDTSDEALLDEIRRVATLIPNQRLTTDAFNSLSRISASAVIRRFGSWSEAKRRANLADALPVYTDVAILDDLRRVAEMFPDEPFTQKFYLMHGGQYSRSICKRRFGGWHETLAAAGIDNRYAGRPTTDRMRSQPGRDMSNEDILAKIRDVAAQLGKSSLSGADIQAHSEINQRLLKTRFGSVSKALQLAGITQVPHGRRHTEDEIFENLLEVWTHYGRPPAHSEMDKPPSTVGSNTYIKRYGGWRNALKVFVERANLDAANVSELGSNQNLTDQVTRPYQADSATKNALEAKKSVPDRQIVQHPHASRLALTDDKPTIKRDPSIGLRFKVLQRDRFRCQLCGRSPATDLNCQLHVDHIIPFSKGGKTVMENLQTLCSECNLGKGSKLESPSVK
jgi:hypothetical protein